MTDAIELTYDPLLLPTAQHRAGLAGLVVLRDSLAARAEADRSIGAIPEWRAEGDGTVRARLTKGALQTLFDDLYDAHWEERRGRTRPQGQGFRKLREVEEPGADGKPRKLFVYEVVAPKAGFYDEPLAMPEPWRQLWRSAIWATLRGRPKARLPYQQRIEGKPVDLAARVWADLTDRRRGKEKPTAFSEALFVGAQSETADKVPFQGPARETLLLHFWPVVTLIGLARQVKTERSQGRVRTIEEDAGYVFAVPDVADVRRFARDFPRVIGEVAKEVQVGRERRLPAHAVFSIPQEGALEYIRHLFVLAAARAEQTRLRRSVTGVETYQLMKRGNNVPILAMGRVEADERLAQDYENVRDQYWSPLFRGQVIRNLLRGAPWYRGFDAMFETYDRHLFAGDAAAAFGHDARARLEREQAEMTMGGVDGDE